MFHCECDNISGLFRISKIEAKCSLATSAHIERGQTMFSIFSYGEKKFLTGCHGPKPPKYATV